MGVRAICMLLLVFLLALTFHRSAAFDVGHGNSGHWSITENVLKNFGFCERIRDAVFSHNRQTDWILFAESEAHCDAEEIQGCHRRVLRQRQQVIDLIRKPLCEASSTTTGIDSAWEALGEALHTLQDFYAHSTYIEWLQARPGGFSVIAHPQFAVPGAGSVRNVASGNNLCPDGSGKSPDVQEASRLVTLP